MNKKDSRLGTVPGVKANRLGFLSHDGESQIRALLWTPEKADKSPKAIIQLAHGMEEHIGRYSDFANYLASQGFVVCAHDMVGHGWSVPNPEKLGCIPLEEGKAILIEDAHELRKTAASRYSRQTPYFMFGHSMGSFLMRTYIARYAEDLAGVILAGTGQQPLMLSRAGNFVARLLARSKGEDHKSAFLERRGIGAYSKKIAGARTGYDWLCTDEAVVDAFMADPLCGVPFSVGAYATLTDMVGEAATMANAAKVPDGLPVLFISGNLDPVGANGKGVEKAAELLRRAGVKQIDVKLYEGMRHEILNEPGKKDVYADITHWIEHVIGER